MKLKSVHVQNFLGVVEAQFDLTAPITLICGPNESGKSSLQEAVRLALLGQALRVEQKKQYDQMIHGTAKRATISIVSEVGEVEQAHNVSLVPSRATGVPSEKQVELSLLSVFDTEHLTGLDQTALRRALFSLSAVDTSIATIEGMAAHEGLDALTIEEIRPFLRAGFQQAVIEAKSRASEARTIWKSITNETYGAQKAEQWGPPIPALPPGDDVKGMEQAYQGLGRRVAELEAGIQQDEGFAAKQEQWRGDIAAVEKTLAGLPEQDAMISGLSEELSAIASTMGDVERAMEATRPREGQDIRKTPCPACGTPLTISQGDIVQAHEGEADAGSPDAYAAAQQEYATLQKARQSALNALEAAKDRQRRRDQALGRLEALRGNPPASLPNFDRNEAVATRDALVAEQVTLAGRIAERKAIEQARRGIEAKVTEAARAHRDVERWVKAEEVYGPDGVPAKILGRAIGPLNAALRHSAELAGWSPIEVSPAIEITYRDLPLAMASESGKWRARAMLVHALAELHAIGTVMLDRMDVLHAPDRMSFMRWAQAIHREKGINFLVFATLKEAPKMPGVDAYWIEGGKLVRVSE